MSHSLVDGVRFSGIASAVPDRVVTVDDDAKVFGAADMEKIAASTGIRSRHVAPAEICASDLCFAAAERLLGDLGWERASVDTLIFLSQTPDYFSPSTSCSLHSRLGLSKHCASFDVNLGCSGYTYGIWLASHLIASGASNRLLLLVGDTISKFVNPMDRSARPIFADAGSATALERSPGAGRMFFTLGTDGRGQNHLIVPAGGFRLRPCRQAAQPCIDTEGNARSLQDLYMNGAEVFLFTLSEVPGMIRRSLDDAGWAIEDVDAFVFHQANRFLLTHLAKTIKIPMEKVVLGLEDYGNTSSASIPLAITTRLRDQIKRGPMRLLLAGYGVGLSWASAALTVDQPVVSELLMLDSERFINQLASPESHLPECLRPSLHEHAGAGGESSNSRP
jgi:3-oxoacyl-[acyl-carrier-protein] synthase-3